MRFRISHSPSPWTSKIGETEPTACSSSSKQVFLNLSVRVSVGEEQGLLALVFHPDYQHNGYFYVSYTTCCPRTSIVSRFTVDATNPDRADASSELILLDILQPLATHNAHRLDFGPDGMLYVSAGDGGCCGDPFDAGQNLADLRGKIQRLDVDNPSGGNNYGIPADNPFAGNAKGWREEIFAYGFRNVWRFSFDGSGRLWAADVGQNTWEEVDWVVAGGNYAWRIMEGFHCFNPPTDCAQPGLTQPIWEHRHEFNANGGFSVIGGHVYEGHSCPDLVGKYVYADYVTTNIWALSFDDDGATGISNIATFSGLPISAFGVDADDERYAAVHLPQGFLVRFTCAGGDAQIVGAQSLRVHGQAPGTELSMDLIANNGIEPRLGGIRSLEFEMDQPMDGRTVDCSNLQIQCAEPTSLACATATLLADQRTIRVELAGDAGEMNCCTFGFDGMTNQGGGIVADGFPITVLTGDINTDGGVSGADLLLIKPHFGETMGKDLTDPRWDFDLSGGVTGADYALIKPRLNRVAPACP